MVLSTWNTYWGIHTFLNEKGKQRTIHKVTEKLWRQSYLRKYLYRWNFTQMIWWFAFTYSCLWLLCLCDRWFFTTCDSTLKCHITYLLNNCSVWHKNRIPWGRNEAVASISCVTLRFFSCETNMSKLLLPPFSVEFCWATFSTLFVLNVVHWCVKQPLKSIYWYYA